MSGRSFILAIALSGAVVSPRFIAEGQPAAPPALARTIADAVANRHTDREVTITGRASVSTGKLQSRVFDVAIEDSTGGMRIFSRNPQVAVQEGDSVIATGAIKSYRGNLELMISRLAVIDGPRRVISPRTLPVDPETIGRNAGRLVRVHGRVDGSGRSEGGQWLRVLDAASPANGTITVWVPANHGTPIDLGRVEAQDSLAVTGVVTSYQDNGDDPVVWQIVPRDEGDVLISKRSQRAPAWLSWAALGVAISIGTGLAISRLGARRQLHALRETEARYTQLLELLPDAVIVHAGGKILFTNPAAGQLLGLPAGQTLVGRELAAYLHPDTRGAISGDGTEPVVAIDRAHAARARMVSGTGSMVDVEIASSPCVYHDGAAMLLLARDITAQLRYERDLHALALVDELTGLQNRRAFTLFAEQELARARRHGRTPVVVFADLDGLKQINDQYGHAAGDTAIRLVANALRSIFREADIVARWSGDEFVAMMVEGSEEGAQQIGARLDTAIATLSPEGLPYVVTASVGASPLDPALPLRDAMERADAELYAQKKRDRRSKIRSTPISVPTVKHPD